MKTIFTRLRKSKPKMQVECVKQYQNAKESCRCIGASGTTTLATVKWLLIRHDSDVAVQYITIKRGLRQIQELNYW